ncbi:MAG: flagellar basal body rod protein FlgC [Gammaproteobacteria bacterium]|nr:flagellar basal body rod protein FlgC [Gammaproteobacteria bacterium]
MALFDVLDIAGSSLSAQSVRLNVSASNLANADTVSSSSGETYRARLPIFETVLSEAAGRGAVPATGVRVADIVESHAPAQREYQPDHPNADSEGYIYRPNVNLVEEMANMMSAARSYQTNVEVANASKQMLLRTLALGQ